MRQLIKEARDLLSKGKRSQTLSVGERTSPKKGGRFAGVSVGRDEDGFYCFTHRARSRSYPSLADVPQSTIAFIRSTG